MASLTRTCFVTAVTLAAAFSVSGAVFAQPQSQPAVGEPQTQPRQGDSNSPDAAQSDPAKPTLSAPDDKIHSQSLKTKSISTPEDCTEIITACQEGIDEGASDRYIAYARKLQAWAHNKRGEMLADAGKEQEALKDFETAARLDPLLWKAVQNRGVSKGMMGDLQGAMADFDRVLELNPSYANAWYNRGRIKYEQSEFAAAVQDFNRAIQIHPSDAAFYTDRGHAYYRMGRQREAISDYTRAVQLSPNDAAGLVNRGDAYRGMGMYEQAANDYRTANRLDPELGRAYLGAAWQMATCPNARFRNSEMAIEAAKKAIELDGNKDYRYLDTLAAALANAGQFAEAKDAAMRAVAIAPDKFRDKIEERLKLYEKNQAYREGGPAEPVRAAVRNP